MADLPRMDGKPAYIAPTSLSIEDAADHNAAIEHDHNADMGLFQALKK